MSVSVWVGVAVGECVEQTRAKDRIGCTGFCEASSRSEYAERALVPSWINRGCVFGGAGCRGGRVRWQGGWVGADYGKLECSCKRDFIFYFLDGPRPAVQRANKRQ